MTTLFQNGVFYIVLGVICGGIGLWAIPHGYHLLKTTPKIKETKKVMGISKDQINGQTAGIINNYYFWKKNENNISDTPNLLQPIAVQEEKEITRRTVRELLAMYEGRTPIQADRLIDIYKGMWIKSRGRIVNILPDNPSEHSIVVMREGNDIVECRFDSRWYETLSRLDKGDSLKVLGKISSMQNGQQLYLLECEIERED